MSGTVPVLSVLFMGISFLFGLALPIALLLYFRLKKHADILPFFIGCAVMLVFAFILERIAHSVILSSPAGAVIQGNLWLYALYGGLMAGIFEETGRLIAFKTVLRKRQEKNINALMYGAGHGGFEALVLLGIAMINNLIWSVAINSGNTSMLTSPLPEEALAQAETAIQTLITTPSYQFLLGMAERVFAVALHLSFSVLVWFAAKQKGRGYLYLLAILLHCAVDAGTVILSGFGFNTILLEAVIGAFAVITACIAKIVWKKYAKKPV